MKGKCSLTVSLIAGLALSAICTSAGADLPQVADLTEAEGVRVTGPVTAWQTPNGPYTVEHLAGQTPKNELMVFWRQSDGNGWRVVDVTGITGERIAGPLTSWQTPNGSYNVEHLAGRSPDDDLLVFRWQPDGQDWQSVNVTQITGHQIAGPPTSWQTPNGPYNVEHLAGRSPFDELLVFWWQPDGRDWRVVNVSEITGEPIAAQVTSWQTSNGEYNVEHLAGPSPENELLVFWWQPDGQDWRVVNVTEKNGEKILGQVTSWQTPNGPYSVEHLAGRSLNNDLLVFYWQPDGRDWQVVNVSDLTGKKIVGSPRVYQVHNGEENVEMLVARGADGELLLFWWQSSRDWQVTDLSEWTGRPVASMAEPWLVDAGDGTPTMEYFAVTTCNDHLLVFDDYAEERSVVDAISKPVHGLQRLRDKQRNVLTILWDPHRPDHPAASRHEVETLLYGAGDSVQGYFRENSGGEFTLHNAGVLGWYDADYPWELYWRTGPFAPEQWQGTDRYHVGSDGVARYVDDEGFLGGHSHKWAEAIRKAAADFDFTQYDFDGNGVVAPDELGILIVIPQTGSFGTNRGVVGRQWPNEEPLYVDGVRVNVMAEAYIASPPSPGSVPIDELGTVAHELAHLLFGLGDMYFGFFQPYAAGGYSLMDQHRQAPHLDPFAKLKFGWVQPRTVLRSGEYRLTDVETRGQVWMLADPARGLDEYFILENRWGENTFDQQLRDQGLAVWHIVEDREVYGSLPAPPNADLTRWNQVGAGEWARRSIRMLREHGVTPPFDNTRALWDEQSAPGVLFWADGSPSGFSVDYVSAAGPELVVGITSPLDDGLWDSPPPACADLLTVSSLAGSPGTLQHFLINLSEDTPDVGFELFGGFGDADLYVREGQAATVRDWDYRPYLSGNEETVMIPSPRTGPWHAMVRAYADYEEVSLETWPYGLAIDRLSGRAGDMNHFAFELDEAIDEFKIEMYGGTGDADIYVKEGVPPSPTDWDYRPYRSGNAETVSISSPGPGLWHIMIRGYDDFDDVRVRLLK